jgi:hypothetical protein
MPMAVRAPGGALAQIPPRLSVFAIQPDRTLRLMTTHDLDVSQGEPFWSGFIDIPD